MLPSIKNWISQNQEKLCRYCCLVPVVWLDWKMKNTFFLFFGEMLTITPLRSLYDTSHPILFCTEYDWEWLIMIFQLTLQLIKMIHLTCSFSIFDCFCLSFICSRDKEPVDYYDVGEICVKIKGCTSRWGNMLHFPAKHCFLERKHHIY